MRRFAPILSILLTVARSLVGCAHGGGSDPHAGALSGSSPESGATAMAEVRPLGGSTVKGTLVLTQLADGGVKVEGTLHGLQGEGMHGFHIHENGDCSASDGASAGGHFNPAAKTHGDPASPDSHVGDLGNIVADAHGDAKVFVVKKEATLLAGNTSFVGRSIIVHKTRDDLKSQPAGDSGARVGCAVVKASAGG